MSLYSKLLSASSSAGGQAQLKISKTDSNPAAITIDEESQKVFNRILSKFRRCLCKKVADNEVKICYLDDTNSNFYYDGTPTILTGKEGDVMVYFPEFWYKGTDDSNNYIFNITDINPGDESWKHASASLVGAYKGYITSNKLYSRSGVERTSNVSMANFSTYARNRGQGYHLIDYQQHCIIAWMFYAKYKTRNSQKICGTGHNSYSGINNGTTNSLGMKDTTPSNAGSSSNKLVNFLGLEGCWGYVYEWIEGIHTHKGDNKVNVYDKGDFHDKPFSNITSPTKRQFNALNNSGYIKSIYSGEYMDMLPSNISGASDTTYFCDYGNSYSTDTHVFRRSYDYANAYGGVSYLDGSSTSSHTYGSFGSRLAFDGNITVVNDVTTFKELPVL